MATAIWKKIAAGQIDPVYLLTGLEQHIIRFNNDAPEKSVA